MRFLRCVDLSPDKVFPASLSPRGGESRETIVLRIVDDLQHKCPPPYHKTDVNRKIEALGGRTPLNIFLSQEIDRMQLVILEIRKVKCSFLVLVFFFFLYTLFRHTLLPRSVLLLLLRNLLLLCSVFISIILISLLPVWSLSPLYTPH